MGVCEWQLCSGNRQWRSYGYPFSRNGRIYREWYQFNGDGDYDRKRFFFPGNGFFHDGKWLLFNVRRKKYFC